jgi:hypothetical protein
VLDAKPDQISNHSSSVPKSLQRYQKREKAFQLQFKNQLDIWAREREEHQAQEPSDAKDKQEHSKRCDVNLYKERGDTYPIIANRILHLA